MVRVKSVLNEVINTGLQTYNNEATGSIIIGSQSGGILIT